jgi:hypothetical protein
MTVERHQQMEGHVARAVPATPNSGVLASAVRSETRDRGA